MSGRAPVAAWILISALVLGACGCTASNPTQPGPPRPSRPVTAHDVQLSRLDPKQQAVELRTRLEELFGQDVFVGIRVTRSRLRGDPDFTQAAVSALSRNSDDLTKLFAQVYGGAQAEKFRGLWETKQQSLIDYARAVSQHDQAAKASARSQLDAFPRQIAQYLHHLTGGKIAAGTISSRLRTHVNDLMDFTDAYAARDYATAYRIERVDYERQFALGTVIAAGIAGGRTGNLPASFDSPSRGCGRRSASCSENTSSSPSTRWEPPFEAVQSSEPTPRRSTPIPRSWRARSAFCSVRRAGGDSRACGAITSTH